MGDNTTFDVDEYMREMTKLGLSLGEGYDLQETAPGPSHSTPRDDDVDDQTMTQLSLREGHRYLGKSGELNPPSVRLCLLTY